MAEFPLALPTGSDEARDGYAGVARLINCYAENAGTQQKAQMQIWAAPGLDRLVTLDGTGGVRRMIEVDGVVFAVVNRAIYQIDPTGGTVFIGGIPSDGYVGMTRNSRQSGVQITVVCDGGKWFIQGGTLTPITDPDLPGPIDVCTVNKSTIFLLSDGRMFRSEIDDTSSIDGLDVAEAESSPDGGYRIVDRGGDLVAFGPKSYEIWQDQGGEAFGFSRSFSSRVGSVGPRSIVTASIVNNQTVTDSVAWAATNYEGKYSGVVMLVGSSTQKISTGFVDREIEAVADKTSIVATSWVSQGQGFIAFRLPTTTLVYNTATGQWHDRQSRDSNNRPTAWRVSHAVVLDGKTLVGDADNPKFYWLDNDTHDEDGDEIVMACRTPIAHAFPKRLLMSRLSVDVVPGKGLPTGASQDVDPSLWMRISRDGGTWHDCGPRLIGAAGRTNTQVWWSRIGTHRQLSMELKCSAAVVRCLLAADWDGEVIRP